MAEHDTPVGWADVVTKHDLRLELAALGSRLDAKMSSAIGGALTSQTRTIIVANASLLVAVAALAAILAR